MTSMGRSLGGATGDSYRQIFMTEYHNVKHRVSQCGKFKKTPWNSGKPLRTSVIFNVNPLIPTLGIHCEINEKPQLVFVEPNLNTDGYSLSLNLY